MIAARTAGTSVIRRAAIPLDQRKPRNIPRLSAQLRRRARERRTEQALKAAARTKSAVMNPRMSSSAQITMVQDSAAVTQTFRGASSQKKTASTEVYWNEGGWVPTSTYNTLTLTADSWLPLGNDIEYIQNLCISSPKEQADARTALKQKETWNQADPTKQAELQDLAADCNPVKFSPDCTDPEPCCAVTLTYAKVQVQGAVGLDNKLKLSGAMHKGVILSFDQANDKYQIRFEYGEESKPQDALYPEDSFPGGVVRSFTDVLKRVES